MARITRAHSLVLAALLLLAAALRLGVFLHVHAADPGRVIRPDSLTYEAPALALLQTGRYAVSPQAPHLPELGRPPGYPLLLAACYGAFGPRRAVVIALQLLLSVATVGLTWRLGRRLFGPRVGLAAAALLALEPISIVNAQFLISDTLFTFLFLLFLNAAAGLLAGPLVVNGPAAPARPPAGLYRRALLCGLLLAVATLVRPVSYYLVFPFALGLGLVAGRAGRPRRVVTLLMVLILAPWLALVGGWQARNRVVGGSREFSNTQSYNLLWTLGAGIVAARDGVTVTQAQQTIARSLPPLQGKPPTEVAQIQSAAARELIRRHPGAFARALGRGLVNMFLSPGQGATEQLWRGGEGSGGGTPRDAGGLARQGRGRQLDQLLRLAYQTGFMVLLYGLLLAGLWALRGAPARAAWPFHLLAAGLVAYFILTSAGFEANSRYRLPLLPLLALYGAVGLCFLAARARRRTFTPSA